MPVRSAAPAARSDSESVSVCCNEPAHDPVRIKSHESSDAVRWHPSQGTEAANLSTPGPTGTVTLNAVGLQLKL